MIRILVYWVAILVAGFSWLGTEAMAVEEIEYRVLEQDGKIEIREYVPHLVAETFVEGEFGQVGNEGFRRLAAYIFGENNAASEVAMTAPVSQEPESRKIAMTAPVNQQPAQGRWRISFVMPSKYSVDTIPRPIDDRIALRQVPAQRYVALRYSGGWGEDRYQKRERELQTWMAGRDLVAAGSSVFARYNPPFMPWFLRRNEVLIPLAG